MRWWCGNNEAETETGDKHNTKTTTTSSPTRHRTHLLLLQLVNHPSNQLLQARRPSKHMQRCQVLPAQEAGQGPHSRRHLSQHPVNTHTHNRSAGGGGSIMHQRWQQHLCLAIIYCCVQHLQQAAHQR